MLTQIINERDQYMLTRTSPGSGTKGVGLGNVKLAVKSPLTNKMMSVKFMSSSLVRIVSSARKDFAESTKKDVTMEEKKPT